MQRNKILATLVIAPMLLLSGQAFAADVSNSNTGADSTNRASSSIESSFRITNSNSMYIDNHVSLDQSTGNNQASMNTGSGMVDSGGTNTSITITNSGNTISINGADMDTTSETSGTTKTTISGNANGTVSVTNNDGTQKVQASLGPNGSLNVNSASDQNDTSKALVLSASTGNLGNYGTANDPFSATQSDSLSVFFVKYILPLLLIGLILASVVWGYVRKKTDFQT